MSRTIKATSHGLTMATSIPLAARITNDAVVLADAESIDQLPQFFIVAIPDANSLTIEFSGMVTVSSHGLTVGSDYFLNDSSTHDTKPGTVECMLWSVKDANTLILRDQRPSFSNQVPKGTSQFIVTPGTLKSLLRIENAAPDVLAHIDAVHVLAERAVMEYVDRDLAIGQRVELLPGHDEQIMDGVMSYPDELGIAGIRSLVSGETIRLKHTPVHAAGLRVWMSTSANAGISSVTVWDTAELTYGSEFYLDIDDASRNVSNSGILYLSWGTWSHQPRSIKIQYWSGDQIPDATLQMAVIETVANIASTLKRAGQSATKGRPVGVLSESLGDYSYSVAVAGSVSLPQSVKNELNKYRRWEY